ncbi:MAG: hypothetical protein AAGD14_03380 [Planctomycetota bacterium]
MPSRFVSVLKLAALLTALLMTGIGIAWVGDILTNESAQEFALKSLGIVGVFTVGMLIVADLGGSPSESPKDDS